MIFVTVPKEVRELLGNEAVDAFQREINRAMEDVVTKAAGTTRDLLLPELIQLRLDIEKSISASEKALRKELTDSVQKSQKIVDDSRYGHLRHFFYLVMTSAVFFIAVQVMTKLLFNS